jgi:NAD(P)-dependent dehydrogenase (short-subunit alcohol dehydrogenase family)
MHGFAIRWLISDNRYALYIPSSLQKNKRLKLKQIYGAANVAGVVGPSLAQERGTIRNITDEEFDWVMDINLKGVLNCLRAELPDMQEGRDGRGGGAIVNVASLAGLIGVPYDVPYVASKHAVVGITKVAAKEEGSRAIRVNAVCP